ncbi:MAG: hypothetical protein HYZ27_02595, partial [Deltaproteobacteria bacterium]|nr:hypothetical protein [Deltaproteobacteria bacterium]
MSILFYPLRWLWLLLPPDSATSLVQVLHLAIGAASTTWLLRTFRCSAVSSAAGGVAFALSGTCLDLIVHSCYIVSAAWIPLAWAAARSVQQGLAVAGIQSRRVPMILKALALATACLGLLFGGDPQGFGLVAAIVLFESAVQLPSALRGARGSARPNSLSLALLGSLVTCVVVASSFAIALFQGLGSLDELSLGFRGAGMSADEVLSWSLSRDYWAGLILPGWSSSPVDPGVTARSLWFEPRHPNHFDLIEWNRVPYLGALALAAIIPSATVRRARGPLAIFLVGLAFAFGRDGLVLPKLLDWIPAVGTFRYPAKYMLVTTLAAVVISVIVIDR